jgi:hypothetical protein
MTSTTTAILKLFKCFIQEEIFKSYLSLYLIALNFRNFASFAFAHSHFIFWSINKLLRSISYDSKKMLLKFFHYFFVFLFDYNLVLQKCMSFLCEKILRWQIFLQRKLEHDKWNEYTQISKIEWERSSWLINWSKNWDIVMLTRFYQKNSN